MTPAIALLTIGFILLKAGWKNQNIVDVVLGRDIRKSTGNVSDGTDVTDSPASLVPQNNLTAHMGTAIIDGHPVALWIVPYVKWARNHGWRGQVTSGWRDPRQKVIPSPGLPVAPQGRSNHNSVAYPGGAIDVSSPYEFARALQSFPGPVALKQGTAIGDPIHFSATGR
jgi:hypothetical protein